MDEESIAQSTEDGDTIPDDVQEQFSDTEYTEDLSDMSDDETEEYEDDEEDTEYDYEEHSESESSDVSEPFITVQYNHKNQGFTKEEAIKFIQKGMHTESLRNKLEYAAAVQGVDVNTLVDYISSAPERAHREYLEGLYGEGSKEVEIGMEIYRQKQPESYKKIIADHENSIKEEKLEAERKNVNSRLAEEYITLKAQMPQAPKYSDLPDSVIIEAAQGKRDLYSAYLCYLHEEKQKINAAKKSETAAQSASTGAMKSGKDDLSSADIGFLSGLWTK